MTAASRTGDGRTARRGPAVLLALPTALWYLLFLIAPLVVLVVMSVGERSPNGGYAPAFTLTQYAALPSRFTPLVNTLGLAALNTAICALVAFPVAYTLALKVRGTWKLVLVALVVVPFWTSFLIRTYAWMTLLGGNGIPRVLGWMGFENVQLLNTPFAVSLGIVYNYLPLMVLPIYVSLERLDRSPRFGRSSSRSRRPASCPGSSWCSSRSWANTSSRSCSAAGRRTSSATPWRTSSCNPGTGRSDRHWPPCSSPG